MSRFHDEQIEKKLNEIDAEQDIIRRKIAEIYLQFRNIPENEKQLIGIIQGIKKFRIILRSEHGKGRISSEVFVKEDKKFDYNIAEKFCPVDRIIDVIATQKPKIRTDEVFPEFRTPKHKNFNNLCDTIIEKCSDEEEHFIYAYWDKLDTYLHYSGTESDKVDNHLKEINENLEKLSNNIGDDSLIIVTADHGQIDIEEVELWSYEKIVNTFRHNPSIEPRATAFFIKEDQKTFFENEFNKHFRDSFILYKSEDFIKTHLLGYGSNHKLIEEFLGDHVSVAISNKSFKLSNSKNHFKAQHAGLTKDEMLIPLILLNQKK